MILNALHFRESDALEFEFYGTSLLFHLSFNLVQKLQYTKKTPT